MDTSFDTLINGKYYSFPDIYDDLTPNRMYKTTYKGKNYVKNIAPTNQQEIIQILPPGNKNIFKEAEEAGQVEDDVEDKFEDDDYLEVEDENKTYNFSEYDPNTGISNNNTTLENDEKKELYDIFNGIEKNLAKGGRKGRKTRRKGRKSCRKRRKMSLLRHQK
jgi:hypothetical protein